MSQDIDAGLANWFLKVSGVGIIYKLARVLAVQTLICFQSCVCFTLITVLLNFTDKTQYRRYVLLLAPFTNMD